MIKIKKGDKFRCIRPVIYGGKAWYIKGKVYKSEADYCITNESGTKYSRWLTDTTSNVKMFLYYFKPYVSNKRKGYGRYTKVREEV